MSNVTDILAELAKVRAGATLCPGELAKRLGITQAGLRPRLIELSSSGRIVVSQRGETADLRTLRGPYRVALR